MYDRIPSPGKENRVSITQDNGQVITGVLAYADDATQEGSAYTKGNVLPDDVCNLLEIDPDTSEPKDAFFVLGFGAGNYGFKVKVLDPAGNPVPGVVLSGVSAVPGNSLTTDENGIAFCKTSSKNASLTATPPYMDMKPTTVEIAASGSLTNVTVSLNTYENNTRVIDTSGVYKFSPYVSDYDVAGIGGGMAGYGVQRVSGGYTQFFIYPGAAGEINSVYGKSVLDILTVKIGAGGVPKTNDSNFYSESVSQTVCGGDTTIDELAFVAAGAKLNGISPVNSTGGAPPQFYLSSRDVNDFKVGYNGVNGNTPSVFPLGDNSIEFGGSGAIGGVYCSTDGVPRTGGKGALPGGGDGGNASNTGYTAAQDGKKPGAGGGTGGAQIYTTNILFGGSDLCGEGAPGAVVFRWRYKQA